MELPVSISRDELVVLQLLEEIQQLVDLAGGETKPGVDANPRMHPAAKLYLDTRDTFEVIENLVEEHVKGKPKLLRRLSKQSSSENVVDSTRASSIPSPTVSALNDAVIDRIQEMFRHLGSLLGPSILKELRLPDGTLSTIFGDDGDMVEENVAIKFETLIADVYSGYLKESLDVQMQHLTQASDQWALDTAVTSSSKQTGETGPPLIVHGGLAKWVGQRVLVNNGKDSVWVEVEVVDVDDKRCKLQMKKSLQKCAEVSSWTQFLSMNEWVNLRELHFIGAPVNPQFRVQMGLKFREILESVQTVVVEISSVFPNGDLNDKLLLEYVNNTVLIGYGRNLGVHEKVYELAARMLLDVLTCIAEAYESLVIARAREGQWKIDILYLVCGVYKLLKQLDQMFSSRGASQGAKGKRKAMNDIRSICLRLLVRLAIRSGPVNTVLETLVKKTHANNFEHYADVDTISELDYHIASIIRWVDPNGDILGDFGNDESEKELGRIHTIFGSMAIKKLVDVQLNWAALISRSSLPKQTLLGILQQRHELGDWPFPVLSEIELQARCQIQQFIDQFSDNTTENEQEEHDVTPSEQPANNAKQDKDISSHPCNTSEEPSLTLPA
ncbi:hypothetical protein PInf_025481 [Phytophthora infestans]|nr:hypothetical protein PInf_025481 [Phytophthora infestans]